jgi:hypothetical protein
MLGLSPTVEQLEAVGLGWWAGQVAATLSRLPGLRDDGRWMSENVDAVLARIES